MIRKIIFTFVLASITAFSFAEPFSAEEKRLITCARERIYIIYQMLDSKVPVESKSFILPEKCGGSEKAPIKIPKWLIEELPLMDQRAVVYNEKDKVTLTESDVWRTSLANIYEFLTRTEELFDTQSTVTQDKLTSDFITIKANFLISLDRLNTPVKLGGKVYSMKDSFSGRGRSLIPTLELINSEFDSVIESFSGPSNLREDKFRKAADAIGILTNNFYSQFFSTPIPLAPDPKDYAGLMGRNLFGWFLIGLSTILVFVSVLFYVVSMEQRINNSFENFIKRSNDWAEDFNRQFIAINVKHIVGTTVLIFAVFGALFGYAVGGFTGVIVFLLILGLGAKVSKGMPGTVLKNLKRRRGTKINNQLMDSLILLSNSLKAGMDIVQAFEMVSKDMKPPIADEFGLVIKNYQLGSSFEQALEMMEDRVENRLLSYMIKAIVLQRQVGGNLTKIFERIVETIREESKLEEKLQAMTAQQRIQSIVVGIMPWLMISVMFLFRPDAMINFYTSGIGLIVLFFCIFWILMGMKMVSKLGEIKV
ncbi:TadB [Elusimicrobium minutum Pei191]|uniref:TadB n=1 Tax=Elusimicrobium minutum (strain Pei191) TaxID=445932 RepID=B2KE09_ELUMP|nr:type II secretion system F family protein [Elusimicrobium minutum]ACC98755.1 TadB [Elusimicrobium minutum Pei191]